MTSEAPFRKNSLRLRVLPLSFKNYGKDIFYKLGVVSFTLTRSMPLIKVLSLIGRCLYEGPSLTKPCRSLRPYCSLRVASRYDRVLGCIAKSQLRIYGRRMDVSHKFDTDLADREIGSGQETEGGIADSATQEYVGVREVHGRVS